MISIFSAALSVLLGASVTTVPAPGLAVGNITINHGAVWQTSKAGVETQGFLSIHNDSQQADTLTHWACSIADKTEMVDAKGNPVTSIAIPPGQTVTLGETSTHLVLQSTHFTVERGSVVPCTMTFQQQGDLQALLYSELQPTK